MRPSKVLRHERRAKARNKAARRAMAFFKDANAIIIAGARKVIGIPHYAKARDNDFPTTPVTVWRDRLYLIDNKQVSVQVKGKRVINPFRIPYGYVNPSRNTPRMMAERDARKHEARARVMQIDGIPTKVITRTSDKHEHKIQCVIP